MGMRLEFRVSGASISNLNTRDIVWVSLSVYIAKSCENNYGAEGERGESSGSCVAFPLPQ